MHSTHTELPEVAVVLCTHNGAAWVEQQVESLLSQTYPVAIRLFDDASTDDTVEKVQTIACGHNIKCIERTEALGFVINFADGIQSALDEGFQYIALADQDDVWVPERIEKGMKALLHAESARSGLHLVHSNLTMVDAHNQVLHHSFLDWRDYGINDSKSLATVLGQNGVMGNTILMNASLARLALPFPKDLHVHDYWLALIAELFGERHYLNDCLVRYRIHDKNASNSSRSVSIGPERWFRNWSLRSFLARDFRLPFKEDNRSQTIAALLADSRFSNICEQDRKLIDAFQQYLQFTDNRFAVLITAFRNGFFRSSLKHRLRVAASILTTQRYSRR